MTTLLTPMPAPQTSSILQSDNNNNAIVSTTPTETGALKREEEFKQQDEGAQVDPTLNNQPPFTPATQQLKQQQKRSNLHSPTTTVKTDNNNDSAALLHTIQLNENQLQFIEAAMNGITTPTSTASSLQHLHSLDTQIKNKNTTQIKTELNKHQQATTPTQQQQQQPEANSVPSTASSRFPRPTVSHRPQLSQSIPSYFQPTSQPLFSPSTKQFEKSPVLSHSIQSIAPPTAIEAFHLPSSQHPSSRTHLLTELKESTYSPLKRGNDGLAVPSSQHASSDESPPNSPRSQFIRERRRQAKLKREERSELQSSRRHASKLKTSRFDRQRRNVFKGVVNNPVSDLEISLYMTSIVIMALAFVAYYVTYHY